METNGSGDWTEALMRSPQRMSAKGQTRISPWGPHVRFRQVQTLVRERSPSVKLRNSA